jgi:AraC-like DNA-binding protein
VKIKSAIAEQMDNLAQTEGVTPTRIPEIKIFKTSQGHNRKPLMYEKGIVIVGQGAKRVFLGNRVYAYDPDNYLVMSLPIPAECEAFATGKKPMLSMFVDIRMETLNRVIRQMNGHAGFKLCEIRNRQPGLFLSKMTLEFRATILRLLTALQSPMECEVLGQGLVRELLFRIMCGENAGALYALAARNTNLSRVDKALKQIHLNFTHPMQVEDLARLVNMSPSSFHRAFKEVTACSPLQYIKKIRLNKACALLLEQGVRVNEAAVQVGYESSTQFSREFKRYFGHSPMAYASSHSPLQMV